MLRECAQLPHLPLDGHCRATLTESTKVPRFGFFFMKSSSAAVVNARLCLKPTSSLNTTGGKKKSSRTYPKVMTYLLQTFAIDEGIAEVDAALTRYSRPSTMLLTQYADALVTKLLRCGEVHDKYNLKEFFCDGLHASVCRSVRSYWSTHPGPVLYDLARHAKSLREIQKGPDVGLEKRSGDL